ncbi:VOC family protein [Lentibacillus amyloliquefaciens]|uniref:PhnB-like domain-containing protein n=1 Tax=Lentibacillus amyloliquefaciens TaxID=1472767 RepID=A0A0U4FCT9_9BACI|nr:VOC family protein [Lentibacillus amyloliquefaciens]ALX48269.1 hypothetical protein AOX59_06395 [Lentibacillus amyloliquefaciens]
MTKQLTPFLVMPGNAKEAIQFYKRVLDAEELILSKFSDMPEPEQISEEIKDRVAFSILKIGESKLMISDSAGSTIRSGNLNTICIETSDAEESKRIYDGLKEDGNVNHALSETPFSPAFANLTDKFGVSFQILTKSTS